jgi:anti-sigma B factor antagonist
MSDALPGARVEAHWNDSEVTVTIDGELDLAEALPTSACFSAVANKHPGHLVLDLTNLVFIDCAGTRVISAALEGLQARCTVELKGVRPSVRRVFALTGMEQFAADDTRTAHAQKAGAAARCTGPMSQSATTVAQANETSDDATGGRPIPDVVELILAEHARITKLIEELRSALADPAATQSDLGLAWASLAGFLRLHVDAAQEIAFQAWASTEPNAASAIMQEAATNADIHDAVQEARLASPGSPSWIMAVQAACSAATSHIASLESGPLARLQHHIAPATRRDLGGQWVAFMTAQVLDAAAQVPHDLSP